MLEVITLESIREGKSKEELDKLTIDKLLKEGLIEKVGKTANQKLRLSKDYFSFINKEADYTKETPIDNGYIVMKIAQHLTSFQSAKMGDFVDLFDGQLSRERVKTIIYNLSDEKAKFLEYTGKGFGRKYVLGKAAVDGEKILQRALQLGLEQMKKQGEIK